MDPREQEAELGDGSCAMASLPETPSEGPGRAGCLRARGGSPASSSKIKERDKPLSSDTQCGGRAGNQTLALRLLLPQPAGGFPTSLAGFGKGHPLRWNVAREQCQPASWPCLHAPRSAGVRFPCGSWGQGVCVLYLLPAASSAQLRSPFLLPPNAGV